MNSIVAPSSYTDVNIETQSCPNALSILSSTFPARDATQKVADSVEGDRLSLSKEAVFFFVAIIGYKTNTHSN